jgi:hypothetical protein
VDFNAVRETTTLERPQCGRRPQTVALPYPLARAIGAFPNAAVRPIFAVQERAFVIVLENEGFDST